MFSYSVQQSFKSLKRLCDCLSPSSSSICFGIRILILIRWVEISQKCSLCQGNFWGIIRVSAINTRVNASFGVVTGDPKIKKITPHYFECFDLSFGQLWRLYLKSNRLIFRQIPIWPLHMMTFFVVPDPYSRAFLIVYEQENCLVRAKVSIMS